MNKFSVGDIVIRVVGSMWPNKYGEKGMVGIVVRARSCSINVKVQNELFAGSAPSCWELCATIPYTEEDLESIVG